MFCKGLKHDLLKFSLSFIFACLITGVVFKFNYFDYVKFPVGVVSFDKDSTQLTLSKQMLAKIPVQHLMFSITEAKLPNGLRKPLNDEKVTFKLSRFDQIAQVKLKISPNWIWFVLFSS